MILFYHNFLKGISFNTLECYICVVLFIHIMKKLQNLYFRIPKIKKNIF